jgi:hypothetical protein
VKIFYAILYINGLRGSRQQGRGENYYEEHNDLYSLPNIVWVIKLRRMRWQVHVARMGEWRGIYRVLVGKQRERDQFGDAGIEGRIILRWIFRKWDVGARTTSSYLRTGTGGGHL